MTRKTFSLSIKASWSGLLVSALGLLGQEPGSPVSLAPGIGYAARACGFDLDDDGVPGEPEDCRVCNGRDADPDGDGVAEDLVYVDCDRGVDAPLCGPATSPCRTLDFAFAERTDGAADCAEDIVCFRGGCRPENLQPRVSGVPRVRSDPSAVAPVFEYPADPAMLVGWDQDGDGAYPPYDAGDRSVLDGSGLQRALRLNSDWDNRHFEIAHFSARGYNQTLDGEGGFLKPAFAGIHPSHLYVHDLSLRDINRGSMAPSGAIVFDLFHSQGLRHFAVENVEALDAGGYFARGTPGDGPTEAGPWRFRRLTVTGHGCEHNCPPAALFSVFKLWGWLGGVEIERSSFDCNPEAWGSGPCIGITAAQCSRRWRVADNTLIDFFAPLKVQGAAHGFCDGAAARRVDDVVFERNRLWLRSPRQENAVFVTIDADGGGESVRATAEDITISDNVMHASPGVPINTCFVYLGGNHEAENPGTIRYTNNTCYGVSVFDFGAYRLEQVFAFPHQRFVFRNNVLAGRREVNTNFSVAFPPRFFDLDSNTYDPAGNYVWLGQSGGFSWWQSRSSGDRSSTRCRPSFVDGPLGDLRLRLIDDCAQARGVPLLDVGFDVEGERRLGTWDRGADEVRLDPSAFVLGSRFGLAAEWRTRDGRTGLARPEAITSDSSYLWFFRPGNVEVVNKVLNGCAVNDRRWVFVTGLTDVEVSLRVEDREREAEWTLRNPQGVPFATTLATDAFATCP